MSFRLRLVITVSLLIAISFGIGGTALITVSFQASRNQVSQQALESYEIIQNTLYLMNSLGTQTDYSSLASALSQMAERNVVHWQGLILKTQSEIIYRDNMPVLSGRTLPDPDRNQCVYAEVEDRYGHGLMIASTMTAEDAQLILLARFDLSSVHAARDNQQKLFIMVYGAVVLSGLLTAGILAFLMTRKLHILTSAVRKISSGDLSIRSGITSADEFGQLSRDFDVMADRLQETISKLESDIQRQDAFMGAFAHELKTPMTSILGYADLLRQGDLDDSTRMMAANYIFSEGQRLEKLSFKLLDLLLLKKDSYAMKEIFMPRFLQEVEQALAPVLQERNVRLVCRCDRGKVWLEPDLVKSLLYNLIDNASKAMDTGGLIGVRCSLLPGGCQLVVVDNGRGMEASELQNITEAFYRVDKSRSRKQGGAGLGLTLCSQIAQLHNGSIHFSSHPGTGTQVTVTLYGEPPHG